MSLTCIVSVLLFPIFSYYGYFKFGIRGFIFATVINIIIFVLLTIHIHKKYLNKDNILIQIKREYFKNTYNKKVKIFKDLETNYWIAYCKKDNLSGYGDTIDEACMMIQSMINPY